MESNPRNKRFKSLANKLISKTLIPEAKIVYSKKTELTKPQVSVAIIIEEGLKLYIKKVDPEHRMYKWGLGKCLEHAKKKRSFPRDLKYRIAKINEIRNEELHGGHSKFSHREIKKTCTEFLEWWFEHVLVQDVPTELREIMNKKITKVKEHEEGTLIIDLEKEIKPSKKRTNKKRVKKPDYSRKKIAPQNFLIQITNSNGFQRTYHKSIELSKGDFRGGISLNKLSESSNINLSIIINETFVQIANKSKGLDILLDSKKLTGRRKKLTLGKHSLSLLESNFEISLATY